MSDHPLDDPVRASLLGPQAHLAEHRGDALRYPADVCPFLAPPRDAQEWTDAAALVGARATAVIPSLAPVATPGWEVLQVMPGVQLVDEAVEPVVDDLAIVLGPDDVEEMTDLVRRTRPGPFERRTVTLGTYLGFRDRGSLVAMAGERLHPPGYTEISAVCTDPDHRGRGYAARLVRAVAAGIRARGEVPFLHTTASNTPAIRLYEQLGFRLRARPDFVVVRVPETATETATAAPAGAATAHP